MGPIKNLNCSLCDCTDKEPQLFHFEIYFIYFPRYISQRKLLAHKALHYKKSLSLQGITANKFHDISNEKHDLH